MDFTLTEEQAELRTLARTVAGQATSPEQCAEAERAESRVDTRFWDAVVQTGLADLTTPEAHGGLGFGVVEAALVAEQLARSGAIVPWRDHVVATWVLAHHGSESARSAWLAGQGRVAGVLSTALESADSQPEDRVQARRVATGWALSGRVTGAAWTDLADRVLVPITCEGGLAALALVSPDASGLVLQYGETTTHELHATMTMRDVAVSDDDVLLGSDIVADAVGFARVLLAAEVVGGCERAIELTVQHGNEREQFGKPLAANQAFTQRLADASIAVDAMRVTTLQAAWALGSGRRAEQQIRVAAWWASDGGLRVVRATQHLHGGMGADISYPVHRYFLAVRQRAITLGSASAHLAALGAAIAAEGA